MNITRLFFFKIFTLATLTVFSNTLAMAQETSEAERVSMMLTPTKCVSLRQGQVCYADVSLSWQSSVNGSYCLFSSIQEQPLACWESASAGTFEGEIASESNVVFTLTKRNAVIPLATAELKMAWVYKKKRSSVSWRVF